MITLSTIAILLIFSFFNRTLFWKKQAIDAFQEIAKTIPNKDYLELELATTEQILQELFRRPNSRLMLLVPEEKGPNLIVSIHTMNVSPTMALTMLQRTYEGINGITKQNRDDEE